MRADVADNLSDIAASLEAMALVAEQEALLQADTLLESYWADHNAQADGYEFECLRFGDFLNIRVRRRANKEPKYEWDGPGNTPVTAAINLSLVKRITMKEGHLPDRSGTLGYGFKPNREGKPYYSSSADQILQRGVDYIVSPRLPYLPEGRALILPKAKEQDRSGNWIDMNAHDHKIQHSTPNFPRPAEDDLITFEGLGDRLWAPAGMGRDIYAKLLAEIERGWERPAAPRPPASR